VCKDRCLINKDKADYHKIKLEVCSVAQALQLWVIKVLMDTDQVLVRLELNPKLQSI
jgi:hypothetical protein